MSRAKLRAWVIIAAVGAALILATTYAALSWKRPTPICVAFANSLTGPSNSVGTESLTAAQIYIDQVNATGGVGGRPLKLVVFDDASSADVARDNVQPIADSPCLAVLGHFLSTASLAAGPGYKTVGIPALTGSSSADALTVDNPYYFRAQTPVSMQGRSTAEYLRYVSKTRVVSLLYSHDNYGQSFLNGFSEGYDFGKDKLVARSFDVSRDARGKSVRAMIEAVATDPEPDIIVIGTALDNVPEVLKAIRRRGLKAPVMATGGAGPRGSCAISPSNRKNGSIPASSATICMLPRR